MMPLATRAGMRSSAVSDPDEKPRNMLKTVLSCLRVELCVFVLEVFSVTEWYHNLALKLSFRVGGGALVMRVAWSVMSLPGFRRVSFS